MNEILDTLKSEINDYSVSVGVPTSIIDKTGAPICSSGEKTACKICSILGCSDFECRKNHVYSGEQALRFGGRYIYLCPMGFVHTASPMLMGGTDILTVIAGPMLIIDKGDYIEEYIDGKNDASPGQKAVAAEIVNSEISNVPLQKVTAISNLLYYFASFSSGKDAVKLVNTEQDLKQQSEISDSILQLKVGAKMQTEYPIFKEKELLDVISNGDRKAAQKLLNEILGYIFFSTGGNIDIIKTRVVELFVQLSRTAMINGGVDQSKVLELNVDYIKTIWSLDTIDDISIWMSRIMSSFTQMVFSSKDIKHIDVIQKVISFINLNYMHKITLEDIANEVYLSPSYLSKIFKAEMKVNLSTYLNNIRIEKSKLYLLDSSVNIIDISNMVGFEEQSYYSKVFKSVTGVSPGKYRQLKGHIK